MSAVTTCQNLHRGTDEGINPIDNTSTETSSGPCDVGFSNKPDSSLRSNRSKKVNARLQTVLSALP
ncbi:hypothetical protein EON65_48915 [archaeon]|nr:MAG: hypothetical protein EON65_48915 [archaeon]